MNMKKLFAFILAAIIPLMACAQGQITTKKFKISDFQTKNLKVILSGNPMLDLSLTASVKDRWHISPYEFSDSLGFESLKTNPNFYFLVPVQGKAKSESAPGIEFLTVVKGGPEASKSIGDMLELVSIPVRSIVEPTGREPVFFPAMLDIIQNQILASMESNLDGYTGLNKASLNVGKCRTKNLVFSSNDIAQQAGREGKSVLKAAGIEVLDEDDADALMADGAPNTVVSYTIYPTESARGGMCYKLLIDCSTHELLYYKKHKMSKKKGTGFLMDDINRIAKAKQSKSLKDTLSGK